MCGKIVFLVIVMVAGVCSIIKERTEPPNDIKKLDFPPYCRHCLCMFSSNCDVEIGCNKQTKVCGPFQITEPYWKDGGTPKATGDVATGTEAFENCANDLECALKAVKGYLSFYKTDCNMDGIINCHDIISMHYFGALSCINKTIPDNNLQRFNKCYQEYQVFGSDI